MSVSHLNTAASRLRAAWAVLTAKRCIVLTYDPAMPPETLGQLHLCGPCQEAPARLANAARVAKTWDEIDSEEGQWNALRRANEILKA